MTPTEAAPKCAVCGKPATCFGAYETNDALDEFACDDCCGHGNEDGHCEPVPEALAAPPHGKDAGEEPEYVTPLTCRVCWDDGLDECSHAALEAQRNTLQAELDEYKVTRSTGKEWLAQIASLQARLTEAEGLLREYLRPGRNSPEDLDGDTRAFLKKPPEGGT